MRHLAVLALAVTLIAPSLASSVQACAQPDQISIAAAFDLAANGLLPPTYPQIESSTGVAAVPPSVLKAVGWVESTWRQFTSTGRPLVSYDFGYGIMQITSGMAGAYGSPTGDLDPGTQAGISSSYVYNIAYGARLLAQKWANTPPVGNGDPAVIEDWYYALWAYNGWGWVNNPNNPRFHRQGTPATDPADFPYQERVLYLVAHPPRDADGNPLWQPVHVSLPSRKSIGTKPGPLPLHTTHRQDVPALSGVYRPPPAVPMAAGTSRRITVRISNTGTSTWPASGAAADVLSYDMFKSNGNPWAGVSPTSPGLVALGPRTFPLPHTVLPGHAAAVHATVTAPAHAGSYLLVWDLTAGSNGPFSGLGVLPRAQRLTVLSVGKQATLVPTPTATPEAAETLQYVADTSMPDGTVVAPGRHFTKGWLVFNDGNEAWGSGWRLRHLSGPTLGAGTIAVPPTAPCRSAVILAHLRAPSKPGSYTAVWRLEDPAGHLVGDKLTTVIEIRKGGPGPTPTPLPSATPPLRRTPVSTPTPVG